MRFQKYLNEKLEYNNYPKTAATINKFYRQEGYGDYKLIKDKDYFRFLYSNDMLPNWPETGVYGVSHVTDLTLGAWLRLLKSYIDEYE